MANGTEEKKDMSSCVKPSGSPKVWSVVDSIKKDDQGRSFKFIIQQIPQDRYEEVLDHMCKYFIADEPLCNSCNGTDDPTYIAYFRELWAELLKQGLSIGAFIDYSDGDKPILAGVNMLGLSIKDKKDSLKIPQIKNKNAERVMRLMGDLTDQARIYETYNVDRYLTAVGLSVNPSYRGQALGGHILKQREKIGQTYKIPVTATVFSSPISQKLAARCGFEDLLEKDYADIKDQEGNVLFPNIKAKTVKVMARRLY